MSKQINRRRFITAVGAQTVLATQARTIFAQQQTPEKTNPEISQTESNKQRFDSKKKPVLLYLYSSRNPVSKVMRQQFQQLAKTRPDIDVLEIGLSDIASGKYYGHAINNLFPDTLIVHSSRALLSADRERTVSRANEVNVGQLNQWVTEELQKFQPQIVGNQLHSVLER